MRGFLLGLLTAAVLAAGGFLVYRQLTAGPPVVLPRPSGLQASAAGAPLLPGGWTSSPTVTLGAADPAGTVAGADFEVRPVGQRFSNAPTASTPDTSQAACTSTQQCATSALDPPVRVKLADGAYHWQARLHNGKGVSPWVTYRGVIRVDTRPPAAPQVSSPTDPNPATTYHSSTMRFVWQASDAGSGIAGYSYRLDSDPNGLPRTELRTADSSVTLVGLDTGTWYFHVRALDRAGNWGPPATFPVRIDVTPPGLAHVRFNLYHFNPQFDALRVSFSVTRPATVVRVGVYRQSTGSLVRLYSLGSLTRGQRLTVTWRGKDAQGRPVAAGAYEVYVRAVDRYGHSSLTGWRDFIVDYRRIVVSLSQQRLWAWDGNRLVLTSLVTTGNRALPTPTGNYHIMARFHPYTFISPWPKSNPYYYPPSKVQYALLFRTGGYFIHDAPWRTAFGPGTNSQLGTPGSNYTGTHGCINTPPDVARQLYDWAEIGTDVQVVN